MLRFSALVYHKISSGPLRPILWEGWSFSYNTHPWITLNTSNKVEILPGDDYFNVPMAIFQKASTLNTNYYIFLTPAKGQNLDPESVRLLPIFHFAEISDNN